MTAASGRRDGARAVVPVEATQAMSDALVGELLPIAEWSFQADYARMLSASPSSGSISAEDLERAAEAAWVTNNPIRGCLWGQLQFRTQRAYRNVVRAAFEAAGLTVAPDGEK